MGRFTWRRRAYGADGPPINEAIAKENETEREEWGPIRGRLFASSSRFKEIHDAYQSGILSTISD
jgi:hypothetical protein